MDDKYLKDDLLHFSDPPYVVIKPQYSAQEPIPMLNPLSTKTRYSFNWNGRQKPSRQAMRMKQSAFRNTTQYDTPYFRDYPTEAVDVP